MPTPRSIAGAVARCAAAGLLLVLSGCSGRGVTTMMGVNQPPEIEIVDARADRAAGTGVRVRWSARDPDGRVKQSRWSLTPWAAPARSASAHVTTASECTVPREAFALSESGVAREPERFTLWAVDDAGAESEPASLALFTNNIAPTVVVKGPVPSPFLSAQVPSSFCITYAGVDVDGIYTQKPVKYKFRLFDLDDPANQVYLFDPDSLRRQFAPLGWPAWDSTSADTEFVTYTNLIIGKSYLFALTGFDEVGDYDPEFNLSKNLLRFSVGHPLTLGPRLILTMPTYRYVFQSGGWFDDPQHTLHTEVAAGKKVQFSWSALPSAGQNITGYRWVLDPSSPHDQTPRSGPQDLNHWSEWSGALDGVTLEPFSPAGLKREEHKLYIEARSNPGSCVVPGSESFSLGIIHFVVVRPTFEREILIVDDTRFRGDQIGPSGCPNAYTLPWPVAAELDTFLYARGGVPWRCTVNPPTGVISTPGIFAGYAFDTLGTRGRLSGQQFEQYPGGPVAQVQSVPLSELAKYRHVIWLTDAIGAQYFDDIVYSTNPMTAMRLMSQPGRANTLSAYVRMGGKLWLAGANARASLLPWDRGQNNAGAITRFSSATEYQEIHPGHIVWESAKLRSEITLATATQATRALGRFESSPAGYGALPLALQSRTPATDPMPPTRFQASQFYLNTRQTEFITQPNVIIEDLDGNPLTLDEDSVLDSLYIVQGSLVPAGTGNVAMTRYHGLEHGEVIWTGFDLWNFQRSQCIALVDAVLQGMWGLPRDPVVRAPAGTPGAVTLGSRPAAWTDRWRRATTPVR